MACSQRICWDNATVGRRNRSRKPFTAVIQKRDGWYVAYVEEIPGVNTQGRTLAEARRNLKEALRLVLDLSRPGRAAATLGVRSTQQPSPG